MKMGDGVLTIYPTELAKRRAERQAVCEHGVLDTSRLFTMRKLMDACTRAARVQGFLSGREPGSAQTRLLLEQAAGDASFANDQPLKRLSVAARAGLLEQLIERFAFLAENHSALVEWLLAHPTEHKLHGFGQLLSAWQMVCEQHNSVDRFALNTALLKLAEDGELPREFNDGIQFRAVRWFNPFEERLIGALSKRVEVQIFSVLPDAHAEAAEDRLCAIVRSALERGNEEEWKPWVEDFADAFEADDSNILETNSAERVEFFISAHPYGEIEDAARRIASEIENGTAPEDVALILRDLSPYTDIVPDVFRRFGIPYYFRRGTPAAAHPKVKALIALLAFPKNLSRDRLCDLLLNPAIEWPGVEDREALALELQKKEPPCLHRLPTELQSFQGLEKMSFAEQARTLIEQHGLELPEEVLSLIDELSGAESFSGRMLPLFEELLDSLTLKDEQSTESGVWIINPMDAAGLRFNSVYLAGMDDRNFPQIPKADGLLNTNDRKRLLAFLEERRLDCPRLALSETGEALIQEEILFLTAISAARERLTLSYTQADADGKERAPGEFFERMRALAKKEPTHGESFHTILPAEAVRAQDEARQIEAYCGRGFQPLASGKMPLPHDATTVIQQWLEDNPEFSASALQNLAHSPYVFFIENVLHIRSERSHEDDTDPIDRGNVIHNIMEQVYCAIAGQSDLYAQQTSNGPVTPEPSGVGGWKLSQEGEIPLAVFDPTKTDELLALAREIAEKEFTKAEQSRRVHLGHPTVWKNEKRKILQVVENFIRMDCETALAENRYPGLFEMKFDAKHDLPVSAERDGEQIYFKGKIDRIDLIFDDNGELEKLLVVDYKGKSRKESVDKLEKKIELNLDCQLPLYTFAAQQKFFGACNTPELNENVQAVYHLQERDLKEMTKHFAKKRLTMNQELTEKFLETLFSNVWKLSSGELLSDRLIAGYEDYSHILRTTAIDPKELLK